MKLQPFRFSGFITKRLLKTPIQRFTTNMALAGSSITGLVWDDRFQQHKTPKHHPERPSRSRRIVESLREHGVIDRCESVPLREVTDEELEKTHTSSHIAKVDKCAGQKGQFDGDTHFSPETASIARMASGSLIDIAERVYLGELKNGFACVRPPGHHATSNKIMGFCIFNNVAIAVNALKEKHGIKKILIVDWDVHHGNGTQDIFYGDPDVLYCSIHKHNGYFYPGTGNAEEIGGRNARGKTINIPIPSDGLGDDAFLEAFEKVIVPVAKEWKPEIIFVSCGFDAAHGDQLGMLTVTPHGYAQMTAKLMEINSKVVLALEGGYNLKSISNSAVACCKTLLGDEVQETDFPIPEESERDLRARKRNFKEFQTKLDTVIQIQQRYWPALVDELRDEMTGIAHMLEHMTIREPEVPSDDETEEREPDTPRIDSPKKNEESKSAEKGSEQTTSSSQDKKPS